VGVKPDIHLHVERLVLDDVLLPHGTGARLQTTVESELTRLLAQGDITGRLVAAGAVRAVSGVEVRLGTGPDIGTQIAQAVFEGIGGGKR
jgi:hypothetical protein